MQVELHKRHVIIITIDSSQFFKIKDIQKLHKHVHVHVIYSNTVISQHCTTSSQILTSIMMMPRLLPIVRALIIPSPSWTGAILVRRRRIHVVTLVVRLIIK